MTNTANKSPDILLVDINGLGYAAMFVPAFSRLQANGFMTGAIHGALISLFARMKTHPQAVPVVLWDCKATWRHETLPEYKGTRNADPQKAAIRDTYQLQVPVIRELLGLLGIPQIICPEAEADDVAGVICRTIDPQWIIEMMTRDFDWLQALAPNVSWYSPMHKKQMFLSDLSDPANELLKKDGHFLSVQEYLEAKSLAGDSSDEIPGIEGVGMKTATKVIRAHGVSIRDFWAQVDQGLVKPKGMTLQRMASQASRDIFERNLELMDWCRSPPLRKDLLEFTHGAPKWSDAEALMNEFGLVKASSDAKSVLDPWTQGWGHALHAVKMACID